MRLRPNERETRTPCRSLLAIAFGLAVAACAPAGDPSSPNAEGDLPLGDRLEEDRKADGVWGSALTCKPIPDLPRLSRPEIYISLHGLTVRLVDRTAGFEKVFPVGVGAIDTQSSSPTYGESKTYYPILRTGKNSFTLLTSAIAPCKTWWTDPETGERSPVFAGLPFMPFYGGYAMHGPIDNYRAPNGGNLRRGFVSHGCVRMESADVLELYARIRGVSSVPVRLQREAERDGAGHRVDVPQRWLGAECESDGDCSFAGGICKRNRYSGRGFCTARCSQYCTDRAGYPATFCVADPDEAGKGMCVPKKAPQNPDCRSLDHFVLATKARFGQPSVSASVCVPGSPGWVGDHCFANTDCKTGTSCLGTASGHPGICTLSCSAACADKPGWPMTFCAAVPSLGTGGKCLRTCTPASNASECPADSDCVQRSRPSNPSSTRFVCVPR